MQIAAILFLQYSPPKTKILSYADDIIIIASGPAGWVQYLVGCLSVPLNCHRRGRFLPFSIKYYDEWLRINSFHLSQASMAHFFSL